VPGTVGSNSREGGARPAQLSRVHRLGAAVLAVVAAALAAVPATAAPNGRSGATRIVISGHGLGHGIGLSQWGAEERAAAGQSYAEILAFYYPGTQLGAGADTSVRILLAERPTAWIGSRAAFTITDAHGAVLRLGAGGHTVSADGRIDGTALAFPAVVRPGSAALRLGGTGYDGTFTLSSTGSTLLVVNTLGLEDYLGSVVSAECPGTWHPAALEAQAIASRSYALANLHPAAAFDLYPDDRSQNYHGLARRLPGATAAVSATRGRVLLYDGTVVDALFSAANGGLTSVPDDVWAHGSLPYFSVEPDAFDARGPDTDWGPVTVPLATIRRVFPQVPLDIATISLVRNDGGRVTSVVFAGADGTSVTLDGYSFQQRLGLRSTYFALSVTTA
jgi:SpoIID/LytB domain protein